MGLLDGFEKLITEHGSAAILKERIALINDKHAELERKTARLEGENQKLREENETLLRQNDELKLLAQRLETRIAGKGE